MQISLTPYGMDAVATGFARAPQLAQQEMLSAAMEAVLLLESAVKGSYPKHHGLTRASITADAFSTPTGVLGVVGSAAPVASFIELGTKPHTPPLAPLIDWVADILGKTGPDGVAAARAIQRKIRAHGTKARPLFAEALVRHAPAITGMFERAAGRIALGLAAGGSST